MDEIEEFVDERQRAWCIHCGEWIGALETNRDHVPSRSLLQAPYPTNLPVVRVCKQCNAGFSLDEEYFIAFIGSVIVGNTDPVRQEIPKAARVLEENRKLRERIERAGVEFQSSHGETRHAWTPETERINRIIVKNARGHAYFEYGEPMLREADYVWSAPLETLTREQRRDFERIDTGNVFPEVGSRMTTRIITGQDMRAGWVIVQNDIYRYAVAQVGFMIVRSVLFEHLATEVHWADG